MTPMVVLIGGNTLRRMYQLIIRCFMPCALAATMNGECCIFVTDTLVIFSNGAVYTSTSVNTGSIRCSSEDFRAVLSPARTLSRGRRCVLAGGAVTLRDSWPIGAGSRCHTE